MYDLDHMLNGEGSRKHLHQIIRQAQQDKFARDFQAAQGRSNAVSLVRAILVAVIHIIWR